MTTYKDIHGTKVEVRDDDPANPVNGQVWYNPGTLKGFKVNPAGAWSTGGSMNSARYSLAGSGTYTSALAYGGFASPRTSNTETWNGTSWTEVNNLNTVRDNLMGVGANNTSALCIGGYTNTEVNLANTELWNGTAWSEVSDLAIGVRTSGAAGTSTAAISFAGVNPSAGRVAVSEEWDVPKNTTVSITVS